MASKKELPAGSSFGGLFAESEFGDDRLIGSEVFVLEVFEKFLALANHLDQTATSHVVVLVGLEMLSDLFDARRQHRSLNLWRAHVSLVRRDVSHRLGFRVFRNHLEYFIRYRVL